MGRTIDTSQVEQALQGGGYENPIFEVIVEKADDLTEEDLQLIVDYATTGTAAEQSEAVVLLETIECALIEYEAEFAWEEKHCGEDIRHRAFPSPAILQDTQVRECIQKLQQEADNK